MTFFGLKAHKQRNILLEILPDAEAIIELMRDIYKKQSGGEKAKAARAARLNALQAEQLARNGDEAAINASTIASAESIAAMEAANDEAIENGFDFIGDIMRKVLNSEYDRAIRVLALLYGTTTEKLEEENDLFDLVDKGIEVITNEKILRFFPQLRRLATEMQADTLPK